MDFDQAYADHAPIGPPRAPEGPKAPGLADLLRAADVLEMPRAAREAGLDRLRRSRSARLETLMQARRVAEELARGDRPVMRDARDHEAFDLLFRAARPALDRLAPAERARVEDALVARADAVPRSLARLLRAALAAAAPEHRAAAAARIDRLAALVPGAASVLSSDPGRDGQAPGSAKPSPVSMTPQ